MTRQIQVIRHVSASADAVYAMIADSDRFGTLPGLRVTVLEPGRGSRDGVGMRRRLDFFGRFLLVEEVVGLRPPHVFNYRIRDNRMALQHEFGRVAFTERGSDTVVEWTTRFSLAAGRFTPIAEACAALTIRVAFRLVLRAIERETENTGRPNDRGPRRS